MKEEVMKVGIKIYEIVENIRKRGEIEMNESNREIRQIGKVRRKWRMKMKQKGKIIEIN